ncbi:MAG: helix-turn-helix domain-containing protein [Ketobacter sp.]|nr:MAG: helix-turn-helix domain-containing protein [Ketobacter sp.]
MTKRESTKSRLIKLRELLSLSQKDFSDSIGITQGALSRLETGKSKLSLDTLTQISQVFNINCNWLINGQGNQFLSGNKNNSESERKQSVITRDINDSILIPMIKEEAQAGYIKNCQDVEYLKTLDVYKIPGYEEGNYRLFEISGDSMTPTIYPREIVVSEFIDDWDKIENGSICIVISEEGIIAKRVYFYEEDKGFLILKSDNAEFKTYSLPLSEVIELWKIQAKITSVFVKNHLVDANKMEALESDIKTLKEQVQKLSQKVEE